MRRSGLFHFPAQGFPLILILFGIFLTCTQKSPLDPSEPLHGLTPMLVDMSATPNTIGVGGTLSMVRVRLLDADGTPIARAYVRFSASQGTITDSVRTDASGYAQAAYRSGDRPGTVTVTARYRTQASQSIQIQVVEQPEFQLIIRARRPVLLANGIDTTRVYLLGMADTQIDPGKLSVSASTGRLSYTPGGTLILTSPVSETDLVSIITVTYDTYMAIDTVKFRGIRFTLEALPTQILADGLSSAKVRAILKEAETHVAIPNQIVTFGATLGLIDATGTTDSRGVVELSLTSSPSPGTSLVTATYGAGIIRNVSVEFLPKSGALYLIQGGQADPPSVLANGVNASTISVMVVDKQNRPVMGDSVHFETDHGTISPPWALTNAAGVAQAILTPSASVADSTARIRVSRGRGLQSLQVDVRCIGIQMILTADPPAIIADGKSQSTISVHLKESTRMLAISNVDVSFASSLGIITSKGTTDLSGRAQALLTSSREVGTARVVATYGLLADTIEVPFLPLGQNPYILSEVTASSYRVLANGEESSTITARVIDGEGRPATGDTIRFSSTVGAFDRPFAITDASGLASAQFIPKAAEVDSMATITVSRARGVVQRVLDRPVHCVGLRMSLIAVPNAILANGETTSRILVILKESSNVAVSGAQIRFSATEGLIPHTATTDVSGRAEVALVSARSPGISIVVARYGQIVRQDTVTFIASEPVHLRVLVTPPVIPADGKTASKVTAVVTDFSNNPVPAGIPVSFTRVSGPSANFVNQKVTEADGTASTFVTALGLGTLRIAVEVAALRDTVAIECVEGPVDQVILTSDKDEIRANAIETATLTALVRDAQGFPLANKLVQFSATLGTITPNAVTDTNGIATAKFSSGVVGVAVITAAVQRPDGQKVLATRTIKLTAGGPFSVNLDFNPKSIGVKETGQNQTMTITATVRDAQNNLVDDSTLVRFSVIRDPSSPRHPDVVLSSYAPIPTVAGEAKVSCSSGIIAGSVRIRAEVLQRDGTPYDPPIQATSTQVVVHAGPPYIEDVNDVRTSHLSIFAQRLNIWAGLDTTVITVMVGDRYNNPVEQGTAVYVTTSGGVVTTQSFTGPNGIVNDTIYASNPQPTVNRFYLYEGMQDPNTGQILVPPYPNALDFTIPDFDGGEVLNTYDNSFDPTGRQNNGIARVIAYAEGMDARGNPAKAWDWLAMVFSTPIIRFDENSLEVIAAEGDTIPYQGMGKVITLTIWDSNGNPIASGSKITASVVPQEIQGKVEPAEIITGRDMGRVHYHFSLNNAIDPRSPRPGWVRVKFTVDSRNGKGYILTNGQFLIAPPLP